MRIRLPAAFTVSMLILAAACGTNSSGPARDAGSESSSATSGTGTASTSSTASSGSMGTGTVGTGTGSTGAGSTGSTQGTTSAASSGSATSFVGDGAAPNWVGTWGASPYPVPSGNLPPSPLSNSVLRQVVHVSIGGSKLRLQFSNLSGDGPVTINSAHLALCRATTSVDSTIDTTTDKALAFSGSPSVTIAQGQEIWSDPLDFTLAALANVSITVAFGSVPTTLTGHAGSRTTSYEQTSSTNVSAASMTSAQTVVSWYYISGMEVMADSSTRAIVAMGDSLTDGRGTNNDQNDRWTDDLEVRLQGNPTTTNVAMLNMGIGGTVVIGTTGTSAQARFARDVLGQAGVRYVILFDGVNDIGGGATAAAITQEYASMISMAHHAGMLIYGATITPFGTNTDYSTATEAVRQQVNTYIKSGAFDAFFDFEAAVTDGKTPPSLQTQYDTLPPSIGTDGLHLNPLGYQQLANAVNLAAFVR